MKIRLRLTNRWLLVMLAVLGFVVLQSQADKKEIGKQAVQDIKGMLKSPYMDILASSDLISWEEFKTRFERVKAATASFETKYKDQMSGMVPMAPIASEMPAPTLVTSDQAPIVAPTQTPLEPMGSLVPATTTIPEPMQAAPVAPAAPVIAPAPAPMTPGITGMVPAGQPTEVPMEEMTEGEEFYEEEPFEEEYAEEIPMEQPMGEVAVGLPAPVQIQPSLPTQPQATMPAPAPMPIPSVVEAAVPAPAPIIPTPAPTPVVPSEPAPTPIPAPTPVAPQLPAPAPVMPSMPVTPVVPTTPAIQPAPAPIPMPAAPTGMPGIV